MTEDELFIRQAELTVESDNLSDSITTISHQIETGGEDLRLAKAEYLISPGSKEYADQLSTAQTTFDRLISEESEALKSRNGLQIALETIDNRLSALQAKQSKLEQTNLKSALPAKTEELELAAVNAITRLIALRTYTGMRGASVSIILGNLMTQHADLYHGQLETMKAELFKELAA